jgi:spore coat protein CotH
MLNRLQQFVQTPEALALAAGLLQAGGPSLQPTSLSQGLGQGILNMQQTRNKEFENKYKENLAKNVAQEMQLRQEKMDQQRALANDVRQRLQSGGQDGQGLLAGLDPQTRDYVGLLAQSDPMAAMQMVYQSKQPEYGAPIQGIDEKGNPAFFQTSKRGDIKKLDNISPIPKAGMSVSVDKDGNITYEQGGWGNTNLTKPTVTDLQKDIITGQDYLNRLDLIMKDFKPKYLTYMGKGRENLAIFNDKASGSSGDKEYLTGVTKFNTGVEQLFNQYRKEITGAAAALAELDRLKASMLNKDMSPEQFEAAEQQLRELITSTMTIKQDLLNRGLQPGSKEFGQAMDAAFFRQQGGGQQSPTPTTATATQGNSNTQLSITPEQARAELARRRGLK